MGIEVLAVDDSKTMREMVCVALEPSGFTVHTAKDGVHGIEMLQSVTPDAIITDINMPRLDGFGFIEAVRKSAPHRAIPILVLTTEGSEKLKQKAREAGATGWIVKPFDPEKLIRALFLVAG